MKYSLVKDQEKNEILFRDGRPLCCPFKASLLIPGHMAGQLAIHREPCGSHCPHFTIENVKPGGLLHDELNQANKKHVFLSCGCTNEFFIEEETQTEKIVKL